MKLNMFRGYFLFSVACLVCLSAAAFRAPDRPQLPNFDKRPRASSPQTQPDAAQTGQLQHLRSMLSTAKADFDPVTGSPKFVSAGDGYLTGANGAGKAVLPATAAAYAADPHGPTKAFLREHQRLFGFGPEALDQAEVKRQSITPHNGLKTVVWQQQLNGIPVFEALLISHTTRSGELVNISSQFVTAPPASTKLVDVPSITAEQAVALAAQNVGEETKPEQVSSAASAAATATKRQQLHGPGLAGNVDASLVWLPMSKDSVRLCWDVIFTSRSRGEMFRLLVDAQTGEALVRHGLTEYLTDVTYRVFTNDSPSPFSPGWPTPMPTQPPLVTRSLVTLSALSTNASPLGWIPDGGNETLGNNVDAHTDLNIDNFPDLPRPQGSPVRVFDFPLDLTQAPSSYQPASVVQLFYLNNWMHDKLYDLGFTEAAGNFQSNNFGRGGFGNDAVQADAQDGAGTDNANFSTPPDGSTTPPRMQMYIFNNMTPNRDGDLDAEVVLHEYTHGLSSRRVGGGSGLSALQSSGMGEGWSDFYALALLSQPGDDINGCYALGAYASYLIGMPTDNLNYYFGIRRYPYSTDMTKNPLTLKDIDPAQADYCSSGAPFHTGMFGSCSTGNASEVHNQGEVWCMALWEARANLILKHGWAIGNQLILQIVTDGLNLSPPNPNFLQARDAILQADGGANRNELWAAFAKRGMGYSATSPASTAVTGIHEAFDMPDDLRILPLTGFVANGPAGGPFNVSSQDYSLTNFGAASLTWSLVNTGAWLSVSPSGGTLAPGGPQAIVNIALNSTANSLPVGIYNTSVVFSNLTSGIRQSRAFGLRIGQPDYFTELFDATLNDLAFSTLTFTPDGSSSYYRLCLKTASSFPTDPAGGTPVTLSDDSFVPVTLSGASVSLYGQTNSVFYIGSNGYLTLNSGDIQWIESLASHFNRPRIAALFHDLLPGSTGASVSWKQLPDRVVVTYQNVPDITHSGPNSFQIEWFFDGRIRITYLGLTNRHNLVGLSRGTGVPAGFLATDLSSAGTCDALLLTLPSSVAENSGVLANAGRVSIPNAFSTNLTITLSSSDTSEVIVPPNVLIAAGQTKADFDVTIVDDALVDGTQIATITASSAGVGSVLQSISILDNETAALALALPASVAEGQGTAQSLVRVSAPGTTNISVSLSSSDTNKLIVPETVVLPAGQSSALFALTIVDNFVVNPSLDVTITAHAANWIGATGTVTVLDNPLPIVVAGSSSAITIPDSGPAAPYPSILTVAGVSGLASKVTVTLTNINHTYPDDIAVLLVGPTGTNLVLMSNVGDGIDLVGTWLTFDDAAATTLSDGGPIASGTFRPTAVSPGAFPSPAPAPPWGSSLTAFNGLNPNGTWRLYVYDDASGDLGAINNGWYLTIQTYLPPPPAPVLVLPVIAGGLVHLELATVASHLYCLEYAQDLTGSPWLPMATLLGDGTVRTFVDPAGIGQRFYRVRAQ